MSQRKVDVHLLQASRWVECVWACMCRTDGGEYWRKSDAVRGKLKVCIHLIPKGVKDVEVLKVLHCSSSPERDINQRLSELNAPAQTLGRPSTQRGRGRTGQERSPKVHRAVAAEYGPSKVKEGSKQEHARGGFDL